mgnify:FL=1
MKKISIIVPCYNVAPYLRRCVDSILNQTYSNFELILVDDGSTDKTGILCDELCQLDARIKVIHKKNGGLSDARNAGIDIATGDFLAFVDGDDYLEINAYELMVTEMQDADVSLVSAGMITEDINGNINKLMNETKVKLSREEALANLLGNNRTIGQSSCNKLFRKQLFEQLRYKKGIIYEDMQLLPQILDICEKVVLLNVPVYHYVKRSGSITENKFSRWKYEGRKIADEAIDICKQKYPSLVPYAYYYKLDSVNKMYEELILSVNRKEYKKEELILRVKICLCYLKCMRYTIIKKQFGQRMKDVTITALFGVKLTHKLVDWKARI